jgi:hypothetical protein
VHFEINGTHSRRGSWLRSEFYWGGGPIYTRWRLLVGVRNVENFYGACGRRRSVHRSLWGRAAGSVTLRRSGKAVGNGAAAPAILPAPPASASPWWESHGKTHRASCGK